MADVGCKGGGPSAANAPPLPSNSDISSAPNPNPNQTREIEGATTSTFPSGNAPPSSSTFGTSSAPNSNETMEIEEATTRRCFICPKRTSNNTDTNTNANTSDEAANYESIHEEDRLLRIEIDTYLKLVKKASKELMVYGNKIWNEFEDSEKILQSLGDLVNGSTESLPEDSIENLKMDVQDLKILKKKVLKLKLQIPAKHLAQSDQNGDQRPAEQAPGRQKHIASKDLEKLPSLCKTEVLECSSAFKDFKALYDGLNSRQKLCLLCFSVFPEKVVIKKRFMIYWWIAERFVVPDKGNKQRAEDLANDVFRVLMKRGFIEPFSEKRSLERLVDKCRVHPFVRATLIILAKEAKFLEFDSAGNPIGGFLEFDSTGKPIGDFFRSYRACLVDGRKLRGIEGTDKLQNSFSKYLEKLHMLFNFNETILEFENPEWFSMMKNINILCLGRWQTSSTHHIEVEDTKFLEGLKRMRHLKLLSLQGISQITELPTSVSELTSVTILDLRACPNLEKIPKEIGLLNSLTHLDLSECYLLVNMPKEISKLSELEVLKGFVVGNLQGKNSCTLEHLAELRKLRKLSIYTGLKDFPNESERKDLYRLTELEKLRIEWGGSQGKPEKTDPAKSSEEKPVAGSAETPGDSDNQNQDNGGKNSKTNNHVTAADSRAPLSARNERNFFKRAATLRKNDDAVPFLPPNLKKLDLQCFPQTHAPYWLMASNLNNVEKLYIRGGRLRDLRQFDKEETHEWKVEILRLKFLNDLEMDWRELREMFPKLNYLEKMRCPKLTFFPCDEQGVWMKNPEESVIVVSAEESLLSMSG